MRAFTGTSAGFMPNPLKITPTVSGWSSGRPDFEAKSALGIVDKIGTHGNPGVYQEMLASWPALRTAVSQTLDAVGAVSIVTDPLEGETAEEADFNDRLESLLFDRTCLVTGDGYRKGFGNILRESFTCVPVGFSVLVPYWDVNNVTLKTLGDHYLYIEPLSQAAVYEWEVDHSTGALLGVQYQSGNMFLNRQQNMLAAQQFVHFAHNSIPGQYFGDGELRAHVANYHLVSQIRRQQFLINERAGGFLDIMQPQGGISNENRAQLERMAELFGEGQNWVIRPFGSEFELKFPTGNPPDLIGQIRELDSQALQSWASVMDTLGVSQNGSRATAEVMEEKSARVNANKIRPFVSLVYERISRWIAHSLGYKGRVRRARPTDIQEVDRLKRVDLLGKATASGLVSWGGQDEDAIRDYLDLSPRKDKEGARAVTVGQVQAVTQIINLLAPPADQTPLAPDAAINLLMVAGVERQTAEAIVAGQVGAQEQAAPERIEVEEEEVVEEEPMSAALSRRPGPRSAAQTPSKPSERVSGSKKNPEGSAGSSRGGIEISAEQEKAIKGQIEKYKEKYPDAPTPDMGALKAVYRRGAGAFSGSHRPGMTRAQWALARTQRFLDMLRGGDVKEAYRKADGDLLPKGHPAKLSVFSAVPPAGVRAAAKNGIERHENGETGSGIEPSTVAAARRLASGDSIGEEQIRKGNRFWARNERFLTSDPGTPAWASAQLWGGRAGMSWYRSQYNKLEAEDA